MNALRPLLPIALAQAMLFTSQSTAAAGAHDCATTICRPSEALAARSPAGAIVARAAIEMIGIPYSWGGGGVRGPGYGIGKGARTWGFDCSGLAEYAWARAGVMIGTTTQEQWRSGARVPKEQAEPGDLVFYDNNADSPGPEHVGIVLDATRMVHAPYTGQSVRVDPLERRTFMGVVRPGESAAFTERG
ncbi:NlpC/P60 family protein [Nonomuraea terrae]|uniref:NlpC/P60 family protein n=1 Tax=Nonomuraea terrae TaxID=2530383 RepID=A0A4R4YUV8_9ACTN|nr:C40 family peptidase [Nonomuraea terrae]TDD49161.1 NlpC/P60 family protein [Nonomuraea terrae]